MTRALGNVRPLRPMRILLATDDTRYAGEMVSAATRIGVPVEVVAREDDVEVTAVRLASNVIVFDATNAVSRTTRRATAFAALHPRVAVGVVADRAPERSVGNLRVFDKWSSVDRILGELERAFLGVRLPAERHSWAGE